MGYFSNGSEGDAYFHRYCVNCDNLTGSRQSDCRDGCQCPIWDVHLLYNYDALPLLPGGDTVGSKILDYLIPRSDDKLHNEECVMFRPTGDFELQEAVKGVDPQSDLLTTLREGLTTYDIDSEDFACLYQALVGVFGRWQKGE
jgi:hypothetical protein